MAQNKLNEELNQLLKGTHMGASIFEELRDKLSSDKLKKEFHEILEKIRMHEYSLTALVNANHGDPVDNAGIMGTITDIMYNVKNAFIDNDKQILEEAIKCMKSAMKALHKFDERHYIEDENLTKTLSIMKEDYESIYHMLQKYLIEFKFD